MEDSKLRDALIERFSNNALNAAISCSDGGLVLKVFAGEPRIVEDYYQVLSSIY
jgi:hypothetical protein